MKKNFKILIFLILLVLAAGCQNQTTTIINMAGSTSVQPLAELLAENFMKLHPEIAINVQGGGSTAGIQAVSSEVAQIGLCSRSLNEGEKKLISVAIAYDGVAVVVNPQNKIDGLDLKTLAEIYARKIKKWSDVFVGGSAREIDLVTREEGSGTREAFTKKVMEGEEITASAIVEDATGVVREIVAADPAAIGYISLGIVNHRVKPLKINGVFPDFETVKKNLYQISRPFLFIFKQPPAGNAKEFLDFVLSPAGQKIVHQAGFVPVKNEK